MRVFTRTLVPLLFAMTIHAQNQPTTLNALRDQARPLLIFGGAHDTRVEQQYAILAAHAQGAKERDMQVVLLTNSKARMHGNARPPEAAFTPEEAGLMHKRFDVSPNQFTVILVGKDGGEKLRSQMPIAWDKLAATIDAMPMRKDEMKQR